MSDYYEIVLDGDEEILRGFVAGYLAASGLSAEVFVAREFHVEHDSLAHQLAEWIGLVADRTHFIVPEQIHSRLEERVGQTASGLGIQLVEQRRICEARFGFGWKTYSREVADELRARFESAPDGVTLDDYAPSEEIHEDETGATGGYAPVHPYEAKASGVAHGAPGVVITWAAELRQNEFIEVDAIRLEYAD
jgi:hypothetical protein